MEILTKNYLAKQGVLIAINSETGLTEAQKIDDPQGYSWEMNLDFIPKTLNNDEEAEEIIFDISHITLDDETITEDERQIIIEDCYNVLTEL